jgi:hypothetical protein
VVSKKLLQLGWNLGSQSYELKAFSHLSTGYYYLQNVERTKYYQSRVLRGLVEEESSGPKMTALRLRQQRQVTKGYNPEG